MHWKIHQVFSGKQFCNVVWFTPRDSSSENSTGKIHSSVAALAGKSCVCQAARKLSPTTVCSTKTDKYVQCHYTDFKLTRSCVMAEMVHSRSFHKKKSSSNQTNMCNAVEIMRVCSSASCAAAFEKQCKFESPRTQSHHTRDEAACITRCPRIIFQMVS